MVISLRRPSNRFSHSVLPEDIEAQGEGRENDVRDEVLLVVPVDCTADVYREILVQQSSLRLLESSLLPRIKDQETADFTAALQYFADWDGCDRDSYEWLSTCSSGGAMSLLRDPARGKTWRQEVWGECPEPIRVLLGGRDKVFLFFLIADRCFSMEDAWQVVLKVGKRLASVDDHEASIKGAGAVCVELTDTQSQLMDLISQIRRQQIDVEDKLFRRCTSRIGASYQVDLRQCPPGHKTQPSIRAMNRRSQKHSIGLVYSPNHGLDCNNDSTVNHTMLDQFLQNGREKIPLHRGLLVTAVTKSVPSQPLHLVASRVETYLSARGTAAADSRIGSSGRNRVCMVEKCMVIEIPTVPHSIISPRAHQPPIQTEITSLGQPRPTVTTLSSRGAVSMPVTGAAPPQASTTSPITTRTVVDLVDTDDDGREGGHRHGQRKQPLTATSHGKDTVAAPTCVWSREVTSPQSPVVSVRDTAAAIGAVSTVAETKAEAPNQDDTLSATAAAVPEPSAPTLATPLVATKSTTKGVSTVKATTQMHICTVHDSSGTYSIPTSQCFPRPSWEESLLQALHKHDYDVEKTLVALETDLESLSMEVQMSKVWDEQTIHLLFRVAR